MLMLMLQVLLVQICKQRSGTVAQTQIESLPNVTLQCDYFNNNNNERKQVKDHKNIYVQMPVFKCYILKS